MLKTEIVFDINKKYSINNNILFDVVIKLEEISRQLKSNNIEETKNKITDIIIMMSHVINENDRNIPEINSKIKKLYNSQNSFQSTEDMDEIEFENGTYKGSFINQKKEGKGFYRYNSGETYEGLYNNNLRDGIGIYTYKDGYIYNGEWKKDKKHGKGILYFPNGEIYEGNFRDGDFDGLGIFHYYNGDKFIGNFKNNLREGYGIKFSQDGSVKFARYSNNKMVKSLIPSF